MSQTSQTTQRVRCSKCKLAAFGWQAAPGLKHHCGGTWQPVSVLVDDAAVASSRSPIEHLDVIEMLARLLIHNEGTPADRRSAYEAIIERADRARALLR